MPHWVDLQPSLVPILPSHGRWNTSQPSWLVTFSDDLPARRWSPIQALTRPDVINFVTPTNVANHCTTPLTYYLPFPKLLPVFVIYLHFCRTVAIILWMCLWQLLSMKSGEGAYTAWEDPTARGARARTSFPFDWQPNWRHEIGTTSAGNCESSVSGSFRVIELPKGSV